VHYNFFDLNTEELGHLIGVVGVDFLPDQTISSYMLSALTTEAWSSMDSKKRIRVASLNIDFALKFGLNQFNYSVKDLLPVLKFNPPYIDELSIDFDCLSDDDAYSLLLLGRPEITSKIDISRHQFGFLNTYNILKNSNFDTNLLPGLNLDELKSYQIKDVIIYGPDGVIDTIDLSKITKVDWLDIVRSRPELLSYCDFEKFKDGDIYDLVSLVISFDEPDLTYLFDLNKLDELTPLGIEKLVVFKTEFAVEHCDLDVLTESSWNSILSQRPDLSDLRDDVCGIRIRL
jgi:hypothetical protein